MSSELPNPVICGIASPREVQSSPLTVFSGFIVAVHLQSPDGITAPLLLFVGNGLPKALILVRITFRHFCTISAAVTTFPISSCGFALCRPAVTALIFRERLLIRTKPTKHSRSPFAVMIGLLVVTNVARESATTTWESQPAICLAVVLARALVWKWLPNLDPQAFLHSSSILQLLSCCHPITFCFCSCLPFFDVFTKQCSISSSQIQVGRAAHAFRLLLIASSNVANTRHLEAFTA